MPDNRWNIAARSNRHGRLGLFYQANPLISVEEILIIHAVQRIELVLSAHAAIQRLAVAPELDILQAAGNAAIPVGVEGVEGGFQYPDIGRASASPPFLLSRVTFCCRG